MSHEKDEKPTILSYPAGLNQASYWRMIWPMYQLMVMEKAEFTTSFHYLRDSVAYEKSQVLWVQRVSMERNADFFEKVCSLREKLNFRMIYDVDDILFREDQPPFGAIATVAGNEDILVNSATKKVMELADEVVTSTPFLKEYYLQKGVKANISVLPNSMPYFWSGGFYQEEKLLKNYHKHKKRPRILYAGGPAHVNALGEKGNDDFSHVVDHIIATLDEFQWVFMGAVPWELHDFVKNGRVEFYPFAPIEGYPRKVDSLECLMMIAPLADITFNHAKADVKFQEAAAHGMPAALQDITPFKHCPIRFDSGEKMIEVIRETLKDEKSYLKASRDARQLMESRWLEHPDNLAMYEELFSYEYGDTKRKHLHARNGGI